MSIRIIIGGPPNSGKSTFAESMARALQDENVDAEAIDLDLWSPTLEFLKGNISKEQRDQQKRSQVSKEQIKEAVSRFKQIGKKKHNLVIGDAPGGMSNESKPIFQAATHGIIVCREDQSKQIVRWRSFFNEIKIPIVAIIISRIEGEESVKSSELINGVLVGLDRNVRVSETMKRMSVLLRSKLGI